MSMFTHILLPVDGSLSMTPLVHKCLTFAAGIGARVLAVHVVRLAAGEGLVESDAVARTGAEMAAGTDMGTGAPTAAGDALAHAARILQEVAAAAAERGVPCDCAVLTAAEPWRAIVKAGASHDVDLICMGSHGRHGESEQVLASQAARVLEHTRLPVLLFR